MAYTPCRERKFPLRIKAATLYQPYLRWFTHLCERLGVAQVTQLWEKTIRHYDDILLSQILSSGWIKAESDTAETQIDLLALITESSLGKTPEMSPEDVQTLILSTPPISCIRKRFSDQVMEKETTAYNALFLRFDFLACLAEGIISSYGKQGELIVYDIALETRLSANNEQTGSVEEFIESFIAPPEQASLFSAGLETVVIQKSENTAEVHVLDCEWAHYFREQHPQVGYLMACSSDEAAYRAFNQHLRMQRTETLMEGGRKCDFKVFTIEEV